MSAQGQRIAVVIPAYNASAYIAATLGSVLSQSRPADEIVVVDDGSTDDTAGIAAGVSSKVRVVRQKNAGQGSARQHGVELTTAEWLLFLDADDLLCETALEKLSVALVKNSRAALAYCIVELWSPDGTIPSRMDTLDRLEGKQVWHELLFGNCLRTPGCALIQRPALVAAGGWDADPRLKGNEDWDLWLRLAENRTFISVPEPLLKYRINNAGYSSGRRKMYRSMFALFSKHRSRWRNYASRRRAVAAGEWRNCKYVLIATWAETKSARVNGGMLAAVSLLAEVVRLGARPILMRMLRKGSRRLPDGTGLEEPPGSE
jgi:glycosyltransferase involved in cell wall biosynthesis